MLKLRIIRASTVPVGKEWNVVGDGAPGATRSGEEAVKGSACGGGRRDEGGIVKEWCR